MLKLWTEFWISKDNLSRISHLRYPRKGELIMRLSQKYLENRYYAADKEPNVKFFGQEDRNVLHIQGSRSNWN